MTCFRQTLTLPTQSLNLKIPSYLHLALHALQSGDQNIFQDAIQEVLKISQDHPVARALQGFSMIISGSKGNKAQKLIWAAVDVDEGVIPVADYINQLGHERDFSA